jgi:hypothetical protein
MSHLLAVPYDPPANMPDDGADSGQFKRRTRG